MTAYITILFNHNTQVEALPRSAASMSSFMPLVQPFLTVSRLVQIRDRERSMAFCLSLNRVSQFFSHRCSRQLRILLRADILLLQSRASTKRYSSRRRFPTNLLTTSSLEVIIVVSPSSESSCYLQLFADYRSVLLIETVEIFILNSGTVGVGLRVLLLVKEEFLLGVTVVFLKTASRLGILSMSLAISLESSWYSISNEGVSCFAAFLSVFDMACELMLMTLSSMMDTSYVFTLTVLLRGGDGLERTRDCCGGGGPWVSSASCLSQQYSNWRCDSHSFSKKSMSRS